jgi:hypothetical protein
MQVHAFISCRIGNMHSLKFAVGLACAQRRVGARVCLRLEGAGTLCDRPAGVTRHRRRSPDQVAAPLVQADLQRLLLVAG